MANEMRRACLFCEGENPNSLEHIIPESLGNDDLLLSEDVCGSCNNYFSKVERYVLEKTEIALWRAILGIRTKKGRLPSIDLSQPPKPKGTRTDKHVLHDNGVGFTFHDDGSCSVEISEEAIVRGILSGEKAQFNFVMTPKVLHELGRFLCKVGIELICSVDPDRARAEMFQSARSYARYGSTSELWPIFHFPSGSIDALTRTLGDGREEIDCYDFSILEIEDEYTLLRLKVGTSNWIVCLNKQWPTPRIRAAFPEADIQLIWYPSESFR